MKRFTIIECSWKILQNFSSVNDKKYISKKIITLPFHRYVLLHLSASTNSEYVTGVLHGISQIFYRNHSVSSSHSCKQTLLLRFLGRNNFQCIFSNPLTLPVPCFSESCIGIKIELNFYFHTSFWYLKRFYEGL